ncbi:Gamma-glutamylcyclotransferase family protein YtfP [Gemmata sp. SH-PL17]|uniref:gamma-glutamylcyclotransferase family protein n=1 Tax=Gemmata sp. SH-PL17 TaxID=1630693 RepID=UPI00078DB3A4|nr:gamma-glutamylcyclotransferase family protein [Gemmata sp. SH-PL17]AMV28206.1 Gamma-glutamylcyclotransferase family protein YtfP [Gemmata sp. SH-PL17]
MASAITLLFVYGTLKRGGRNYPRIADQEFVAEVATAARYRVVDLGPYPGLIRDAVNGLAVHGELFAVDARGLAELDEFEDVPNLFVRDLVEIPGYESVWAYYTNVPAPAGARTGDRWPLAGGSGRDS